MPLDMTSMKYEEFITRFNKQVFSLDYDRQLTLAIDVCKKLYFDYVDFSEKYQWGDKDVLLEAITLIEQSKTSDIKQNLIDKTLSQLDTITPDMDDFGDEISSYGLNASAAVYETLQFLIDKDKAHIYNIGNYLTDTVDFRIQEERDLSEDEIAIHPMMLEARNYVLMLSR